MHRVDVSTANPHRKLQELHVNTLFFGPKWRVHHHQIHCFRSESQSSHVSIDEVEGTTLHFLLQLVTCHIDVLLVQLHPQGVGSADVDQSADEHTRAYSKISDQHVIDGFSLVDEEEEFGSDVGWGHMLFESHLVLLAELEVLHVLQELLDVFLLQS